MEIILDISKPPGEWFDDVPSCLMVLVGHITSPLPNQRFNLKRFYNKPGQRYYQSPIDVGPLFDINANTIGYLIFYKGYQIQVDNVLNRITIIK